MRRQNTDSDISFLFFVTNKNLYFEQHGLAAGTHDADTVGHKSTECVLLKYHVKRNFSSQKMKKTRFFDVFLTKKGD